MSERFSLHSIHQGFDQAGRRLEVLKVSTSLLWRAKRSRFGSVRLENHACYILRGFGAPASGDILVNGRESQTDDDGARTRGRLQHIGFVYQFHNLSLEFSALENVMLPLRLRGQSSGASRAAGDILAKLG